MEHDLSQELLAYVATEYGTKGDHPFKRFPSTRFCAMNTIANGMRP